MIKHILIAPITKKAHLKYANSQIALFDPCRRPQEHEHTLIYIPTGPIHKPITLHLYLDENIPTHITPYCNTESIQQHPFIVQDGQLALGITPVLNQSHPPIRREITLPNGNYNVSIYHAQYAPNVMQSTCSSPQNHKWEKSPPTHHFASSVMVEILSILALILAFPFLIGPIDLFFYFLSLTLGAQIIFSLCLIMIILGLGFYVHRKIKNTPHPDKQFIDTLIKYNPDIIIHMTRTSL